MKTKLNYNAPECALLTLQESSILCQSGSLNPIVDNPDVIELDDIEWIY